MLCIYNQVDKEKITTVTNINFFITCIFKVQNELVIFDVKSNKFIFDLKNACYMTIRYTHSDWDYMVPVLYCVFK